MSPLIKRINNKLDKVLFHKLDYWFKKYHVIVNSETKMIEDYEITPASMHAMVASEMLEQLQKGSEVYGDSM